MGNCCTIHFKVSKNQEIPGLRKFPFSSVRTMTRNFNKSNMIGEGSFGEVYKGTLTDWSGEFGKGKSKVHVAVKRLNPESSQGFSEWLNEVTLLGILNHENLVRLLGYSREGEEAILIYEFLEKGSLEKYVWAVEDEGDLPVLTWPQRVSIAFEIARGISYLHSRSIIHRDLKSSNILLSDEMHAKVTDFGMAKFFVDEGKSHVSTDVMGTMGYLDPEYHEKGRLTYKSDVYSFGVILMEILTGRQPMFIDSQTKLAPSNDHESHHDNTNNNNNNKNYSNNNSNNNSSSRSVGSDEPLNLVDWVLSFLQTRTVDTSAFIDPRLLGRYSEREAQILATLAKLCVQSVSNDRPTMEIVMRQMKSLNEMSKRRTEGGGGGEGAGVNGAGGQKHQRRRTQSRDINNSNHDAENGCSPALS